ncbi:MAG: S24/S26 family peptidase [Ruminococcus sp.]|nr:S24/S26 family peptidase [Ruminococcus sp.]
MTYEEYLESNGEMTYTNVGTSMMPLLRQHRDLFTVRKKDSARCRAGDVVLYRRPPDSYVLHRVVEVRKKDYVILGDNCIKKEYGITDGDIIGVMTGYVRKGREHTVKDRSYRIYKAYIMHTITLRVIFKKAKLKMKRAVRRLL